MQVPWLTEAIRDEIRKCRQMECIWRHDRANLDRYWDFCSQCRLVSNLLFATEKEYYHDNLHEHSGNIKQVFKLCDSLLGRKKEQLFPPGLNNQELAYKFNQFFITKITDIRSDLLEQDTQSSDTQPENHWIPNALMKFRPLSCEDALKIVLASPAKTCDVDPIPTELLKKVLPAIIHLLTKLVNESLQTGEFLDDLKKALVTPLFKKPSLDLIPKNYRPISNLPFVGKLMERCVIDQLLEHICTNNLMEPLQSAYRSHHSTETALLKVKTDILKAMDNQEVTCLVLLDLSAAFDMVDHKILLERLENYFGITRIALRWIKSYLTNQLQRVIIGDTNTTGAKSNSISLEFGVPQGIALGPILFTLYTSRLGQICSNNVHYHLYADDQQIYLSFKPGPMGVQLAQDDCIHHMEGCVEEIKNWMARNMLKLNEEKTEFVIFGTHQQLIKSQNITIRIGNTNITPVDHVRNLGFMMDMFCKNNRHINHLSSSLYQQLRNIQNIRGKLDFDTAKIVVQALILSKPDYCNSLLVGTPKCHLSRLQHLQNMACRVVCNLRKFDHVSPSMHSLHWLKVWECITFKIAYMVYCCKNGLAPDYLTDLLPSTIHNHLLRSSTSGSIPLAKCQTSLASIVSFSVVGPKIWKNLPPAV